MPDVENMVIIAEIFKTTLDELLRDSAVRPKQEMPVYSNETIYDIDCEKHFDVNIGSAATIILSSETDENCISNCFLKLLRIWTQCLR